MLRKNLTTYLCHLVVVAIMLGYMANVLRFVSTIT